VVRVDRPCVDRAQAYAGPACEPPHGAAEFAAGPVWIPSRNRTCRVDAALNR